MKISKNDLQKIILEELENVLDEGWAGGSYFGTLSEPVYLTVERAGEGLKAVQAGEELHGWDKYGQLVAEAFLAAPDSSKEGIKSFNALIDHIDRTYRRMQSRVDVEFVEDDPYKSAEEMRADMEKNKQMKVSSLFNQPGFFGAERNLKFRAVHDYYAHLRSTSSGKGMALFSLKGELRAFNHHAGFLGKNAVALPAVFTEVVGQACVFLYTGDFPDQKIVTLPQFDINKLGKVFGYKIIDKDLIK